jgi:hypothetical protein
VIAEPPLLRGAVNETDALPSKAVADTAVGAFGTVEGITALEADEASEVPMPFVAVTLNVYGAPLVKPETVHVAIGAIVVQVPFATLLAS